jgi:Icc-related predicted phosphoesterase
MLVISDVHDAPGALRRLVELGEEVVILGDLVNLTDYRTGQGAVASVMGIDFARRSSAARARGDYTGMMAMWRDEATISGDDLRLRIGDELAGQYRRAAEALSGGRGLVIHGNVDRPDVLRATLPTTFEYVHGQVIERDGLRFGFVGGGVETPLGADGEVPDDEMWEILRGLGEVDVLCSHVPPAVPPLRTDVITGREERGSEPIREYLEETQPRVHLFGDVHQPQASMWRVGRTRCYNAGYFRATGRFLRLEGTVVDIGSVQYSSGSNG